MVRYLKDAILVNIQVQDTETGAWHHSTDTLKITPRDLGKTGILLGRPFMMANDGVIDMNRRKVTWRKFDTVKSRERICSTLRSPTTSSGGYIATRDVTTKPPSPRTRSSARLNAEAQAHSGVSNANEATSAAANEIAAASGTVPHEAQKAVAAAHVGPPTVTLADTVSVADAAMAAAANAAMEDDVTVMALAAHAATEDDATVIPLGDAATANSDAPPSATTGSSQTRKLQQDSVSGYEMATHLEEHRRVDDEAIIRQAAADDGAAGAKEIGGVAT